MWWATAAAVFAAAAGVDVIWARYVHHVSKHHATLAANYAFLISAVGIVSFKAWQHDWRFVFPTAAGSWVGTMLTVRFTKS